LVYTDNHDTAPAGFKVTPSIGAFGRSQQRAATHRQRYHKATVATAIAPSVATGAVDA